jgi:hypothetical protein
LTVRRRLVASWVKVVVALWYSTKRSARLSFPRLISLLAGHEFSDFDYTF